MEEKCKKCGKELKDEDIIFNGFCEKCYNKWINEKTEIPHIENEEDNNEKSTLMTWLYVLFCVMFIIGLIICAGPVFLARGLAQAFVGVWQLLTMGY